jgi:thymidylate synthase
MNSLDLNYQSLVTKVLREGTKKEDRTGTGTMSIFGEIFSHDMSEGFPLLTTKKMSFKNIKTELVWFISGRTDLKFLVDRGCNIWVGDALKRFLREHISGMQVYYKFRDNKPKVLFATTNPDNDFDSKGEDGVICEWIQARELYRGWHEGEDYLNLEFHKTLMEKAFIWWVKNNDVDVTKRWCDLGPIYGKQWRDWDGVDQLMELVHNLKHNPDSRRLILNAWNVKEIRDGVLPPCHYGFQCYTTELTLKERYAYYYRLATTNVNLVREPYKLSELDMDTLDGMDIPRRRLDLMWIQRSIDTGLGLPYNIASYGLLLIMLANEVNMIPGTLKASLGDTHLYLNHVEPIQEQLERIPKLLPKVRVQDGIFSHCDGDDIQLLNYDSHSRLDLPLSN